MKISVFTILFCSIILFSCKEKAATSLIPEETLADVYAHTIILNEFKTMSGKDSLWISSQLDNLYRTKNVQRKEFESAIQLYQQDLHQWKAFQEKVLKKLDEINKTEIEKSVE